MRAQLVLALLLLSILALAFGARLVEIDGMVPPFSSLPNATVAYAQSSLADTIENCLVESLPDPVTVHFGATMGITNLQQYDSLTFPNEYECFYAKTLADIDGYTSSSLDSQVKSTLKSIPMIGHMPRTYQSYWLVYDRYIINAYRWAQQWSIDTAKWNELEAAQEVISCYHKAGRAVLGLDLDAGFPFMDRYYDENGQILDIMNKFGCSSDALAIWNYLNSAHWNGQIYTYEPGGGFECEVGPFAMLIGYYHATNPTIPYFDRILLDLYNKMLKDGWSSPAWSSSPGVMQHASSNSEKRLESTLNGFTALQAYYCLGSTEYKQAFQNLLTESPKAWEALVSSPLYSSGKFTWREYQNATDDATASGMMLLLLEGIIPDTGCLAIPLNEWRYQDQATMLPFTHFRFDYHSRRIRIPVFAGSIKFQFGTSIANATFPSNGIFEVQFSPDWNNVIGVSWVSPLSDQFHYLLPTGTPSHPPSAQTIYVRPDGSIDPSAAPIELDGNTYTLTDSIVNNSIVIEKDSIEIDGAGYALQGPELLPAESGIYLAGRSNVTIRNMNIKEFRYGISLWSSSNSSISGNNITNNEHGVYLYYNSVNNTVSGNNITDNEYGVSIYYSPNNTVSHNNFLDNLNQVSSDGSVNFWDDGYPSGGNYWSDYTGMDLQSGSYQNVTGSDGIGDTPCLLPANNIDRYPHMKPYLRDLRDIGIAGGTTSRTVIAKASNMTVSLMMFNYGNTIEDFNLTLCANTTSVYSATNLIIENRSFVILRIAWNTSDFARAYNLTVNITAVEGETDLSDNTYTFAIVKVTCVGDINGDYVTDGKDLVLAKKAIPSTPGNPRWNPNADINDDGVIDAKDYQIVKTHIPSIFS